MDWVVFKIIRLCGIFTCISLHSFSRSPGMLLGCSAPTNSPSFKSYYPIFQPAFQMHCFIFTWDLPDFQNVVQVLVICCVQPHPSLEWYWLIADRNCHKTTAHRDVVWNSWHLQRHEDVRVCWGADVHCMHVTGSTWTQRTTLTTTMWTTSRLFLCVSKLQIHCFQEQTISGGYQFVMDHQKTCNYCEHVYHGKLNECEAEHEANEQCTYVT